MSGAISFILVACVGCAQGVSPIIHNARAEFLRLVQDEQQRLQHVVNSDGSLKEFTVASHGDRQSHSQHEFVELQNDPSKCQEYGHRRRHNKWHQDKGCCAPKDKARCSSGYTIGWGSLCAQGWWGKAYRFTCGSSSKCIEHGKKDADCCAKKGTAGCVSGYTLRWGAVCASGSWGTAYRVICESSTGPRRRRSPPTGPRRRRAPPSGGSVTMKFMEWNVHWLNNNVWEISDWIAKNNADIIGIDELSALNAWWLAQNVAKKSGRPYKAQPGYVKGGGYGTDIIYDSSKFDALEGGKFRVNQCSSAGGDRAANWVVMKEKTTGKTFITGGIHLSACGCDDKQSCELNKLYDRLEAAQRKYPGSPVIWMGDMNDGPNSNLINNLKRGKINGRNIEPVQDLSQTRARTYSHNTWWNKEEIDFIFGTKTDKIRRVAGGLTGQGWYGGTFAGGADHRPIYATVEWTP